MTTENQTQLVENVYNKVKVALTAALKNRTLVAIATTVLQDSRYSTKLLTALRTAQMDNKSSMLPITKFIEKTARAALLALTTIDKNANAHLAALLCSAYYWFLHPILRPKILYHEVFCRPRRHLSRQ